MSRHPECVARWPECEPGGYDPRCCRFPKSCSCERAETLTPHEKIAGWLVDDDGNIFTRVTEFTCPNHPHGPPDREWEELTACERIIHYLLHEEPTALKHHGLADEARIELGLCCEGHEWRDTGELREVNAMEIFMRLNMPGGTVFDSFTGSILLDEINRKTDAVWQGVRIPIIHAGTPLPRSAAAEAALDHYNLDPAKPPTVE